MPNWVQKFFVNLILILLVVLAVVVVIIAIDLNNNPSTSRGPSATPGIDLTALAQYTPTPDSSSAQMATAVVIAKPTPYTTWTVGEAELFIGALRDKASIQEMDLNSVAQLSSPGAGWICFDFGFYYKDLIKYKVDEYCKISLTWTEWQLAYKPQNIEVKVAQGAPETNPPLSADGTHYEGRYLADVTIIINDMGIIGPITRFDQSFDFFKDLDSQWKVAADLKELIWGDNLDQKANELTADADDLALADSFAPLQPNGTRSAEYTDQLYAAFVDNLTTPADGHIYNRLFDYATLIANDRSTYGYAGLGTLTILVPAKPNTPCDYVYADNMTTKVLPQRFCVYTLKPSGLSEAAKAEIVKTLPIEKPGIDWLSILDKIATLP